MPPLMLLHASAPEFIRQQWRMWIETATNMNAVNKKANSFASNGECGLKRPHGRYRMSSLGKFIRQQWRMWIETGDVNNPAAQRTQIHSPAMANVD